MQVDGSLVKERWFYRPEGDTWGSPISYSILFGGMKVYPGTAKKIRYLPPEKSMVFDPDDEKT